MLYLTALAWIIVVAFGFHKAYSYEFTPGSPAQATGPVQPATATARPALLLFAHPECPCTKASIAELSRIQAQVKPDALQTQVIFVLPPGNPNPAALKATSLWKTAFSIPGCKIIADYGGAIAANYGARTSGQVIMFDSKSRVQFQGGITASRGHEGDNPGHQAVIEIARGKTPKVTSTPVFGCAL